MNTNHAGACGWRAALLLCLALASGATQALGNDALTKIRERGVLSCGVSNSIAGLAQQRDDGEWAGMDVDFCRALAAALFGPAGKIRVVPLSAVERFPALLAGRVDLIAGGATWTLARELGLKVAFVGPVMFSSQRLLVRADSDIKSLAQLNDRPICLARATTHLQHLRAYFELEGWLLNDKASDSFAEARAAFDRGACDALTADEVALAGLKPAGDGAPGYRLLPETISSEPLSAVVPGNQPSLERVVRWVLFMLIAAETNGIDQHAAATLVGGTRADAIAAQARRYGKPLGLDPLWAELAVAAVGHYGEIFERNLGSGSPIGLTRGPNRPWNQGGMLYAPPLH